MATRNGQTIELWGEVLFCLGGLPAGTLISRWSLKDFLDGCRGNEFSRDEFEEVVKQLETTYGVTLANGSMGEGITSVSVKKLFRQQSAKMHRKEQGFHYLSRLEELELGRKTTPNI